MLKTQNEKGSEWGSEEEEEEEEIVKPIINN